MRTVDILIVGGGPAGLSAASHAYEQGQRNIVIIERNNELGGILNQCIHNGFGLHVFKEELTGPEYAQRFADKVRGYGIETMLGTMVLDITEDKVVTALSPDGVIQFQAKSIILAMGCRERPRGAINIPGSRCAGVYTAGAAQEYVNIKGYNVGKKAVILGSGDIGLIMARRLTFEGAEVAAVIELMPYSGGLKRNIVQCLDDFSIPLMYSTTITKIVGKDRVEGVHIAKVDEQRRPIKGTEQFIECDTLLLSVGLIPENELTKQAGVKLNQVTNGPFVNHHMATNIDGIFACGNVLHVHDLVDNVTKEAFEAAEGAIDYLKKDASLANDTPLTPLVPEHGVRYVIPNFADLENAPETLEIKFRSDNIYTNEKVHVYIGDTLVHSAKKRIITPGEMETVKLKLKDITVPNKDKITVRIGG